MTRGRILYAEDNDKSRIELAQNLSEEGWKVIAGRNGQEALDKYHKETKNGRKVDFVITDIDMPIMDGLTLIERLRNVGFNGPVAVNSFNKPRDEFLKKYRIVCASMDFYECVRKCEVARWEARA